MRRFLFLITAAVLLSACGSRPAGRDGESGCRHARWFALTDSAVVVISPYDGSRDTVSTRNPALRLVCFSTSYVGCLSAIGCPEAAAGVSGVRFVSDTLVRSRAEEVGYEGAPDYEAILGLHPDLVLTYTVTSSVPAYITKLRDLGIPVLVLYELPGFP